MDEGRYVTPGVREEARTVILPTKTDHGRNFPRNMESEWQWQAVQTSSEGSTNHIV